MSEKSLSCRHHDAKLSAISGSDSKKAKQLEVTSRMTQNYGGKNDSLE